jgi:hypothetical protein
MLKFIEPVVAFTVWPNGLLKNDFFDCVDPSRKYVREILLTLTINDFHSMLFLHQFLEFP